MQWQCSAVAVTVQCSEGLDAFLVSPRITVSKLANIGGFSFEITLNIQAKCLLLSVGMNNALYFYQKASFFFQLVDTLNNFCTKNELLWAGHPIFDLTFLPLCIFEGKMRFRLLHWAGICLGRRGSRA